MHFPKLLDRMFFSILCCRVGTECIFIWILWLNSIDVPYNKSHPNTLSSRLNGTIGMLITNM